MSSHTIMDWEKFDSRTMEIILFLSTIVILVAFLTIAHSALDILMIAALVTTICIVSFFLYALARYEWMFHDARFKHFEMHRLKDGVPFEDGLKNLYNFLGDVTESPVWFPMDFFLHDGSWVIFEGDDRALIEVRRRTPPTEVRITISRGALDLIPRVEEYFSRNNDDDLAIGLGSA